MIFQLRLFGYLIELHWVWGLLVGFSLGNDILGLNAGPFSVLIYADEGPTVCRRCLRSLRWGLHGTLLGFELCKDRRFPPLDPPAWSEYRK